MHLLVTNIIVNKIKKIQNDVRPSLMTVSSKVNAFVKLNTNNLITLYKIKNYEDQTIIMIY